MIILSNIVACYEARRLRNKNFIIVSNNCWGSELYRSVDREYNMPFVGLFLEPDSYLKLLENLEGNLESELSFCKSKSNECGYPVGVLSGDIFIHFLHYKTEEEARAKWERRTQRLLNEMNKGVELFVKLCGGNGCTKEHFEQFTDLPFEHKLALGINKLNLDGYLHLPRMQVGGQIFNGQKLFEYRYCYFDVTSWILEGEIRKTWFSRLVSVFALEVAVYRIIATTKWSQLRE